MEKISVIYSYSILIGSIILQNSKVHMYNYLYKIYPKLFGDDYKVLYMDTDSIYAKLIMSHEKYIEILENNKEFFGKDIMGIMCLSVYITPFKKLFFCLQRVIVIFVKRI